MGGVNYFTLIKWAHFLPLCALPCPRSAPQLRAPLFRARVFCFVSFCYWFVGVPYIFWKLTPNLIYGLQIFSSIPQVVFSLCWLYPLLCKNFVDFCSSICLFSAFVPCVFGVMSKQIIAKANVMKLSRCIVFYVYRFRSYFQIFNSFWVYFYIWCKIVQFHPFSCEYPILSISCVEETILSSLYILGTLVKN